MLSRINELKAIRRNLDEFIKFHFALLDFCVLAENGKFTFSAMKAEWIDCILATLPIHRTITLKDEFAR